jgi:16S rRNA (guanine527-N7)-methyltransferase
MSVQDQIRVAAIALNLTLSEQQVIQLRDYMALLHKWNAAYNLSALKDPQEMLVKHLFDCLAVVKPIADLLEPYSDKTVLDVGTGAGLPGVVLAVCLPTIQVTMLDAVQKKITFVRQAIGALRLPNAAAHGIRIQDWRQTHRVITARAWTALADIPTLTAHCLAHGGRIAAMKGPRLSSEAEQLPVNWQIERVLDIVVPELADSRRLAILQHKTDYSES